MRQFAFLVAAIPVAFGCARPPAVATAPPPIDAPLEVRLHAPAAGSLVYSVSEPAYVAIFAMTSGQGIRLVFPYFASQTHSLSSAGLNVKSARGAAGRYITGARQEHGFALPYADALFVIASRYPLPIEEIVRSPSLLASLVGADIFRATHMSEMRNALEAMLTGGLPEDAWASDLYVNRRYPFHSSVAWRPEHFLRYCSDGRSFYAMSLTSPDRCARGLATVAPTPPTGKPRLVPPSDPTDLGPFVPVQPPRLGAKDAFANRASESRRGESARRADPPRYQAPSPRQVEPRPPRTRAPEAKRPVLRRESPPAAATPRPTR